MMLPKQSVLSQRSLKTFFDKVRAEHTSGKKRRFEDAAKEDIKSVGVRTRTGSDGSR